MKKTGWLNGRKQIPFHVGPYQVKDGYRSFLYKWWNGEYWGFYSLTIEDCVRTKDMHKSACQSDDWRGLAQDPGAK